MNFTLGAILGSHFKDAMRCGRMCCVCVVCGVVCVRYIACECTYVVCVMCVHMWGMSVCACGMCEMCARVYVCVCVHVCVICGIWMCVGRVYGGLLGGKSP